MIEITHSYCLTSDWQKKLANTFVELGGELIHDNLLVMPLSIAKGSFYYTQVIDGLSVIIWDVIFEEPILIKRLKSEAELYIIHYDFSEEMNLIHVNDVKHKIGYKANLGLGVFDNATDNVFQPIIGERVFSMRLLVAKELLNFSIAKDFAKDPDKHRIKSGRNKLFFYDHIDSESKIIVHDIKGKTFFDPGFDMYLKGASLQLIAKFIDRYTTFTPLPLSISEKEIKAMERTKEYLMNNLFDKFPGVFFLADMAEMSMSKYTSLFKKMYVSTPGSFFWREKIILVDMLLKSGEFDTMADILGQLENIKLNYLATKYYKQFGKKPFETFIKAAL